MVTPLDVSQVRAMSGGYGCALCRVVFGTLTGFDAHQIRDYPRITCKTPVSMGYVLDGRGVWRTPEGNAQRDRNVARLASLHRKRSDGHLTGTPEHPVDIGLGAAIETVLDPLGDARRILGL